MSFESFTVLRAIGRKNYASTIFIVEVYEITYLKIISKIHYWTVAKTSYSIQVKILYFIQKFWSFVMIKQTLAYS